MQKKIIALAIASAMTVPALAFADASISGQANVSYDKVNNGAAVSALSSNKMVSNNSRVVVKGSEDLGDGMSAIFSLDHRFNIDDGSVSATNPMWGGNAYVGLKSNSVGTLVAGRNDTPYKSSTRGLDVFFDVVGDNRNMMGMGFLDIRLNNSLTYTSPDMSGLSVSAATSFGAEAAQPTPNDKKGSAMSLAAMYKKDAIYGTLAYQTIKLGDASTGDLAAATFSGSFIPATNAVFANLNTAVVAAGGTAVTLATEDKFTAFKLGGGYTMDAITINAVYENIKITGNGGGSAKQANLYLAGKFAVSSSDTVKLAYLSKGATKLEGGGSLTLKDKASQIAVGYDHALGKNTTVYASYVKQSWEDTLADPSTVSLGMKHAF